jgi:hypothetical protein
VTITAPSTYVELGPDFEAEDFPVAAGRPGFLIHKLVGDRIATHSEAIQ